MSTLNELREGLSQAWQQLAEGWSDLSQRAGQALTRFYPPRASQVETVEDRLAWQSADWGLLPAEIREDNDVVEVRLEAPGMEPDEFELQVMDGCLVVRGEKHLRREDSRGRFYLLERAYGRFERAIPLPMEVDDNRAIASYRHGVLTIRLPRLATSDGRRIQVQRH